MSSGFINFTGRFSKSTRLNGKAYKALAFMLYAAVVPFFGCIATKPPIAAGQSYAEDLAQYRPKFSPPQIEVAQSTSPKEGGGNKQPQSDYEIKNNIDPVLDLKMSEMIQANEDITGFPGFTVLAYSGFGKTEAQDIKKAIEAVLEDEDVVLEYDQPNFKVKVGGFLTRAEAYMLHVQIKEEFPESIIISDIIKRNEIKF